MRLRFASINDLPIKETERKYHWALGRRPDDHPGLSDLGFYGPNPFTCVPARKEQALPRGSSAGVEGKRRSSPTFLKIQDS
jgi:hypothetical protein